MVQELGGGVSGVCSRIFAAFLVRRIIWSSFAAFHAAFDGGAFHWEVIVIVASITSLENCAIVLFASCGGVFLLRAIWRVFSQ